MGSGHKVVVGVTGVIGSGKSTFCRFLKSKFGFKYIDADKIVHSLYKVGKPGYKKIEKYFGSRFVGKSGVDRESLRKFLLKNPQKFRLINKFIHPLVAAEVNKKKVQLKAQHKSKTPLLICVEAVYFERKNLGKFVNKIVTVDAPDSEILRRLKSRGIKKGELTALLQFQRKIIP